MARYRCQQFAEESLVDVVSGRPVAQFRMSPIVVSWVEGGRDMQKPQGRKGRKERSPVNITVHMCCIFELDLDLQSCDFGEIPSVWRLERRQRKFVECKREAVVAVETVLCFVV